MDILQHAYIRYKKLSSLNLHLVKNILLVSKENVWKTVDEVTTMITVVEPQDSRVVLDETSTTAPKASNGAVDVLVKRTIKANEWSTICLPFTMTETQVKTAFGDDVRIGCEAWMRTAGKTPLPVGAATCGTKRKRRKTGDSPSPDYTAVASSLYGMRQRSFLKECTSASRVGVYVAPQAKEKEVPHTS